MNLYELEWITREPLEQARAYALRRAMIRQALRERPALRLWLGTLFIRLGTWLQGRAPEADVEAKRAAA